MDVTMAVVSDTVRFAPDPASNSPGPRLSVIDVFDELFCNMPCLIPRFFVTVGFAADATKFGQQVVVWVQLLNPEGVEVDRQRELRTVETPPLSRSRSTFYTAFRFQNLLLHAFGPYVIRVWIDEEHQIDLTIQLSQRGE